jgi:hypothetical protein
MELPMNLHLLDANLILLAAAAILIITALVWLYVSKHGRQVPDQREAAPASAAKEKEVA